MSVIVIQIPKRTMIRLREGEHLSEPVSELEDGGYDPPDEVVIHDSDQISPDLPMLPAERLDPKAVEEPGRDLGPPLASRAGPRDGGERRREPPESSRQRVEDELRKRIRARRDEGPRAWLEEIARAARGTREPIHLFTVMRVPGGRLQARLVASGERVDLVASLRGEGEAKPPSSQVGVRVPRPRPCLMATSSARLELDGSLRELELELTTWDLPVAAEPPLADGAPPATPDAVGAKSPLPSLAADAPRDVSDRLEALSNLRASATPELVFDALSALESLALDRQDEPAWPAPTFTELVREGPPPRASSARRPPELCPRPPARPTREGRERPPERRSGRAAGSAQREPPPAQRAEGLEVRWSQDGRPRWSHPNRPKIDPTALERDVERLVRLAEVLGLG